MIYLFFTLLCIITAGLTLKLYLLQKGIKEIDSCLAEILSKDTNGQIVLSSRSRHICRLASRLNSQLKQLREKQLKYNSGDKELKEAVTNISHDLRTPLTAINGFLELLEGEVHFLKTFYAPKAETDSPESAQCFETETDSTENAQCFESVTHSTKTEHPSARVQLEPKIYIHIQEMQHCLDVLRNRAGHMKQLTDELFRYSLAMSVPEGVPQSISLNRALEECILSFYDALIKKGIVPVISMPSISVVRTLDPAALSRILQNILSNALKYSDGDLEICLTEEGTITCANSAPHLNPLLTEQLFDRYYTVETVAAPDSEHSTGLGLSIARLLTERLGGTISAVCKQQNPSPQNHTTKNRLEITLRFPAS